jgi:hypothetical protein
VSPDPRETALMQRAANLLQNTAGDVREEMRTSDYWGASPDSNIRELETLYRQGVNEGLGGASGRLAALLGPLAAIQIAVSLRHEATTCSTGRLCPNYAQALVVAKTVLHGNGNGDDPR